MFTTIDFQLETVLVLVVAGLLFQLFMRRHHPMPDTRTVSTEDYLYKIARITGASFARRLISITVPLAVRGLAAGGILIFVKIIRDLSLVVLLFTPTMPVLSVVAYRYASEGFGQFANAITVVILFISMAASLIANRLQSKSQPWLQN